MEMKFLAEILNEEGQDKNTNIISELGVDEIKNDNSKDQIKMVWKCDVDDGREDTQENATHRNGGKMNKRKTQNQMDRQIGKDTEMREEKWKEIQENKKWPHGKESTQSLEPTSHLWLLPSPENLL
jgi:hypothetical protein